LFCVNEEKEELTAAEKNVELEQKELWDVD